MSDTTSLWSSEDGFQSAVYFPDNTLNFDSDHDNVDDCIHLSHEVSIEIPHKDDNDSLLSDTTSSLMRFMDEMDDESLSDVSSNDDDTFTTISDLSHFTYDDLFDDDSSNAIIAKHDLYLSKEESGIAKNFLDEIVAEIAAKFDSNYWTWQNFS